MISPITPNGFKSPPDWCKFVPGHNYIREAWNLTRTQKISQLESRLLKIRLFLSNHNSSFSLLWCEWILLLPNTALSRLSLPTMGVLRPSKGKRKMVFLGSTILKKVTLNSRRETKEQVENLKNFTVWLFSLLQTRRIYCPKYTRIDDKIMTYIIQRKIKYNSWVRKPINMITTVKYKLENVASGLFFNGPKTFQHIKITFATI